MESNFSVAEENYIKAIYHLQQSGENVSTNDLAGSLQTKAASVTDMLKKLKSKKLLHYQPYRGVRLNKEGQKLALNIVRRHRLWEFFLVDKLKFDWDQVHAIAEELEHVSSKQLIDQLDIFLNYPKFDPHGDPIPDSNGKMTEQIQINLIDLAVQQMAEVTSVGSQSTELLELLKHNKIGIGTKLQVLTKFSFDHSIEIKIKNHSIITISQQLAQALFVKIL